jgi:hypothetical protein
MLEHLHTPARVVDHLKMGITGATLHTEAFLTSHSSTMEADQSSPSSSLAEEDISQSAFQQQSQFIGWDNALHGRISKLWGEACFQTSIKRQ